jgi:hypothetical protein
VHLSLVVRFLHPLDWWVYGGYDEVIRHTRWSLPKAVNADHRGGGIVDAGRERLDRDIGHLAEAQQEVMFQRALDLERECSRYSISKLVRAIVWA